MSPVNTTAAFSERRLTPVRSTPALPRRQVGVDFIDGLAIEPCVGHARVVSPPEADQRHAHRGPVDHPRFVAPRFEDPTRGRRRSQQPAVRTAPD